MINCKADGDDKPAPTTAPGDARHRPATTPEERIAELEAEIRRREDEALGPWGVR